MLAQNSCKLFNIHICLAVLQSFKKMIINKKYVYMYNCTLHIKNYIFFINGNAHELVQLSKV